MHCIYTEDCLVYRNWFKNILIIVFRYRISQSHLLQHKLLSARSFNNLYSVNSIGLRKLVCIHSPRHVQHFFQQWKKKCLKFRTYFDFTFFCCCITPSQKKIRAWICDCVEMLKCATSKQYISFCIPTKKDHYWSSHQFFKVIPSPICFRFIRRFALIHFVCLCACLIKKK